MLVHVVYVSSRLEIMHFVVWYMTQGNIHRRLLLSGTCGFFCFLSDKITQASRIGYFTPSDFF